MPNNTATDAKNPYAKYIGMASEPRLSAPLSMDLLRQFVLATINANPIHHDVAAARAGPYHEIVAPPLFPIHMFRPQLGGADPLAGLADDPNLDGTGALESILFGLPKIETDLVRLINDGNEVEFYRLLRLNERVRVTATYRDVTFKQSSKGPMIIAQIESRFETEDGQLLLINRTTSIQR